MGFPQAGALVSRTDSYRNLRGVGGGQAASGTGLGLAQAYAQMAPAAGGSGPVAQPPMGGGRLGAAPGPPSGFPATVRASEVFADAAEHCQALAAG